MQPPHNPTTPEHDPWCYGWRYLQRPIPGDEHHMERVPLTLEDVLHPEEDDYIIHSDRHERDRLYLAQVLHTCVAASGAALVLSNVRITWDQPLLGSHTPDLMLIRGLHEQRDWRTFDVVKEGLRPCLIIERTAPTTRNNDLDAKVYHYAYAGVTQYIIVDEEGTGETRQLNLLGYNLVGHSYHVQPPDPSGRIWIDVANIWLGVHGERVICYDQQGQELGDYSAAIQLAAVAEARAASAESLVRYESEARSEAEERAASEAAARAGAEARVTTLEERILAMEAQIQALQAELKRLQ
ncbi:Uma2 family endonuclease [Candidatus Viridilinea mediisalina]|uniref:Putative restriction endonuclease domain-containing protein n=1 Tax=Candidatus Viridilinea mediisalina TaxID=2024553 RepID=A0A2A6RJT3_9CHLR|nr:Uma2 family endonuclease [Candidatus Viridilinea mediisalina]PDW03155.1 hypothetical protein CJ255_10305 [Candidatus Viridilinea mediisalina]